MQPTLVQQHWRAIFAPTVDEASDPKSIEDVVVASSNTTDDVRAGLEQSSAEDRHDFDQHEKQPQHSGQQNLVPAHREI